MNKVETYVKQSWIKTITTKEVLHEKYALG